MLIPAQTAKEADMDPRERLGLRLKARSLDRALAAGASPDASEELALRARALVRADARNEIAASLCRLAQDDGRSPLGARVAAVPARADEVGRQLELVAMRLLDPGPVAPRGVALALDLLSDGAGPLFWAESDEDVRARIDQVLDALEPGISDPKPGMEGRTR